MNENEEKILSEETLPEEEKPETEEKSAGEQSGPETDYGPKEEKIVPKQGLSTDKFDVSEPWLDGTKVDDSVEGLKISYNLKGEEVKKALHYFQKRTIYKKNIIFTVILAVIAVFYAQAIFSDPEYTMGYLMLVLIFAVIFFMWFLPARYIRSAAEAADVNEKENYELEICEQGILMPQENGKYLVGFDRPSIRAVEFSDYYLIITSKEKVFALPKRCIPAEDQQELTGILKNALGPRYELVTE